MTSPKQPKKYREWEMTVCCPECDSSDDVQDLGDDDYTCVECGTYWSEE